MSASLLRDCDPAGRIVRRRALGANTITSSFGYYPWITPNGAGRLQTASHSSSGQTLQAFNYTYSAIGNILSLLVTDPQYAETQTYGYDALSRLTAAAVTGGPANYSESYGYSATTGNLESKGGWTVAYNDPDHVHAVTGAGGNSYAYDANGNQITRVIGGSTYTLGYDAENRLVSVSGPGMSAQFTFDGDGRRVASTINGVTTAFVGNHYEVTGGAATKYYFAGATRVAMRQNGTLFFLLSDHLASTSLTTDANGVKVGGLRLYKAWGELRHESGIMPTQYRYTGQYEQFVDENNELYHYGARFYDPELSRWVQPDPIVPLDTQGVQAWDRFAYVNNNSIAYSDPSGHCIWDLCAAETVVLVVLATAATAAAVSAYYAAGGPEAVTEGLVNLGEVVSQTVDETVEQLAKLDDHIDDNYSENRANFAKGDGGAKSSAEHLAMLLGVDAVAGFGGHPGMPDPNRRDANTNAKGLRNSLRSMQKNMKSGETLRDYLSRQGWTPRQIQEYTNQLRNYYENVLPYEEGYGVNPNLVEELYDLIEATGAL